MPDPNKQRAFPARREQAGDLEYMWRDPAGGKDATVVKVITRSRPGFPSLGDHHGAHRTSRRSNLPLYRSERCSALHGGGVGLPLARLDATVRAPCEGQQGAVIRANLMFGSHERLTQCRTRPLPTVASNATAVARTPLDPASRLRPHLNAVRPSPTGDPRGTQRAEELVDAAAAQGDR